MFDAVGFIEKKRDGIPHTAGEIEEFVKAVASDALADYQTAAWLMAVYFRGLGDGELRAFTSALAHSGEVASLPPAPGGMLAVDKHSTGGVGDKTTLIAAPLAAACGARVAKLSGRGLGFTGGTVDKLESIPGMSVRLSQEQFTRQVETLGCAITGHSRELAPAEGRFYALRDVTGTVPSLPLIASSIVSKKIAGGADAFVFDVKCGRGAFCGTPDEAFALARALVDLSKALGKNSVCVVSDMNSPLGTRIGNALEVAEAVEVLSGGGPSDTRELSLALAAEMLHQSGIAASAPEAERMAQEALDGGKALAKFAELVESQGGDPAVCETPERVLPRAAHVAAITAPRAGVLAGVDAKSAGNAVRAMGGGRTRKEDAIDPTVGLVMTKCIGESVAAGETLIEIHYNDDAQLETAMSYLASACAVEDAASGKRIILGHVGRE